MDNILYKPFDVRQEDKDDLAKTGKNDIRKKRQYYFS